MLTNLSIKEYIQEVDSDKPAPGGGSVAALVGALGVSLARMYGHLSISKKAFLQLESSIQYNFHKSFEELQICEKRLIELVDEDALLYPRILQAYRLPKDTIEEENLRNQAIQQATILAIEGPFAIAKCAYDALLHIDILLPYGNKNVISDAACAIVLLDATIETAIINMEINLASLTNKDKYNDYKQNIITLRKYTKEKKDQLMKLAHPLKIEE
ncbi:MAG: cyclodeaminase/cyclohydrolase family protein [Erysipelotrichaceae bacterium]|nr:cyclodeaminase/cyclohydrolase family protein [Erysipelotrichaceae bacterium]